MAVTDELLATSIHDDVGVTPPWAAESFTDPAADVRTSIARIEDSPFVPKKHSIRGFVFDVATGKLDEVA